MNCRHGIDTRFCAQCLRPTAHQTTTGRARPSRVGGSYSRKSAARTQSTHLSHSFEGTDSVLVLEAQLDAGWKQHKKGTWCFSEQITAVESKYNQQLRIAVSLFHRPNWDYPRPKNQWFARKVSEAEASQIPALAVAQRFTSPKVVKDYAVEMGQPPEARYVDDQDGAPVVTLTVAGNSLSIKVVLFDPVDSFNRRLPWLETAEGKVRLHQQYRNIKAAAPAGVPGWESPVAYEVQMLLVVDPPARKPSPTYWDWNRRFFPGGLPSLNKRRR